MTPATPGNGAQSLGSMIHPAVELPGTNVRVLVEHTTAVDPQRLGDLASGSQQSQSSGDASDELCYEEFALQRVCITSTRRRRVTTT